MKQGKRNEAEMKAHKRAYAQLERAIAEFVKVRNDAGVVIQMIDKQLKPVERERFHQDLLKHIADNER